MPVTNEDDELVMEAEAVRTMHVLMQRMTKWRSQVFQEISLDRRIKLMIETKVFSLVETANHIAEKGKKTPLTKLVRWLYVESSLGATSTNLYT